MQIKTVTFNKAQVAPPELKKLLNKPPLAQKPLTNTIAVQEKDNLYISFNNTFNNQ